MKETLIAIVEKEQRNEIVPFLQSLPKEQKKELVPVVKKLEKKYLTAHTVTNGNVTTFVRKGNERQRIILLLSAFVCFNKAEFERFNIPASILERKILEEVIGWYCPDWFSDFVNALASQDYMIHYLDYRLVLELTDKGYLHPTPELIARLLPSAIYEEKDRKTYFVPEKLFIHPVTLNEHIWILFRFDSNIYYAGRWLRVVTGRPQEDEQSGWMPALKQCVNEGRLDRRRVLQESLYACHRNFNKLASGWFIDLFSALGPSPVELLPLQKELFAVLGSPHSKPVNIALQYVKKMMTDKAFELNGFLDYVPVLLSSSIKSIVSITLGIIEKLPAGQTGDRLMISRAVLQVFIQPDDDLQTRAAKIIAVHKAFVDDPFKQDLSIFAGTMTSSARRLLRELLQGAPAGTAAMPAGEGLSPMRPAALVPLPIIDNIDDLVFIVSQALDNNHSWLIDVVPAALVSWTPRLQGAAVARLEPVLHRALKLIRRGTTSVQGQLDHMLSVFLVDVCVLLVRSRGKDAAALDKLFNFYKQENDGEMAYWQNIGEDTSYMAGWEGRAKDEIYLPYKCLLLLALARIRSGDTLPLLSTPTHEPGWIVPEALVERLLQYQQAAQWPDDMDIQVAVLRCYLHDTAGAIAQAEKQLLGEYRALGLFLFGKQQEPQGAFGHPVAWMAASLALREKKQYAAFEAFGYYEKPFQYYTGQFDWESVEEEYTSERYDYQLSKYVPFTGRQQLLKIHFPGEKQKQLKVHVIRPVLLYDLFRFEQAYFDGRHNDIRRLLLLAPANPAPLLALVLSKSLKYPTFWSASDNKMVIALLQGLHEIWDHPGQMGHVFLGTCMLCPDKTAVSIAAEIWLQQVPLGKMDSASLGRTIGLHERVGYAPLKRFTDLVTQLMRVSALHNQELQVLVGYVLRELPDAPVTNLKKLLEIYFELLDLNKTTITHPALMDKLRAWQQNASVKKIAAQLIASCT